MKNNIKLIAFDLDGTLTVGFSWNIFHAVGGVTSQEQNEWRAKYMNQELEYSEWLKLIETKYKASDKTKADFLAAISIIPFKSGAKEIIKKLLLHYPIHIVSSSIDIYVQTVSRELGITEFHANHSFRYDREGKFDKITFLAPEAEAKTLYLAQLCEEMNLKPNQICFVGDSLGDLGAFKFTGRGILVGKGDERLVKTAWKQVGSLYEILPLLL